MSKQQKLKPKTAAERADQRTNTAIIKTDISDRRLLLGRERNKRSRKYRQKFLSKQPINLTAAVAEMNKKKLEDTAHGNDPAQQP